MAKNRKMVAWEKYNQCCCEISEAFKTNNIVGEFAESLVAEYYHVGPEKPSNKSYDLEIPNPSGGKNLRIQVKSRRMKNEKIISTKLCKFSDWYFDRLVVILFGASGSVLMAREIEKKDVKKGRIKIKR